MSLSRQYDVIIAGVGAAGLWTAYYLQQYHPDLKLLLVDQEKKRSNDRTWCFWGKPEEEVAQFINHSWSTIVFRSQNETTEPSDDCPSYHMIRSDYFYHKMERLLTQTNNCQFHKGYVQRIGEDESSAFVIIDGKKVKSKLVFDSTFNLTSWKRNQTGDYTFLWQHFLGWRIKTNESVFKPGEAVLMDFNTPQNGSTRFFYVLPFSEREALIEYTIFSKDLLDKVNYTSALVDYINNQVGIKEFEILEEEGGKIPMTDGRFEALDSERIIQIGTKGGFVKPTTGYAFINIQQAAKQMISSLDIHKWRVKKLYRNKSPRFFFYDQLLLHILAEHGQYGRSIFSSLFQRNSMRRILTFLEEKSTVFSEARIFASLPTLPFLSAIPPVLNRNLSGLQWMSNRRPATEWEL